MMVSPANVPMAEAVLSVPRVAASRCSTSRTKGTIMVEMAMEDMLLTATIPMMDNMAGKCR
ncbi:hypothetical protein D1872_320860 [compost metagenome]